MSLRNALKKLLAMDAESNRSKDENGFLKVENCNIMKAGINGYYGMEIAGGAELGLDPNKLYQVYRPFDEMEKAAATFAGLPILSEHEPVSASRMTEDDVKRLTIGSIGTDVRAVAPYLVATLTFTDGDAIHEIEAAKTAINAGDMPAQLSPCYYYTAVVGAGEFEGQPYEIKMTNIRGNHLAKVLKGREGADVVVADNQPEENSKMKELLKRMAALLPAKSAHRVQLEKLAMDEAPEQKLEEIKDLLIEVTGELEEVIDQDTPEPAPAADAGAKEKLVAILSNVLDGDELAAATALLEELSDAPAGDQDPDEEPEGKKEEKLAMDSATIKKLLKDTKAAAIKEFNERERALATVRPLVGELDRMAFDTAEKIYTYTLKTRDRKVEGLNLAGMQALCETMAETPKLTPLPAMDADALKGSQAAGMFARLPGGKLYGKKQEAQ